LVRRSIERISAMTDSDIARRLADAGCVAAEAEAAELLASARDAEELDAFVRRRITGEPLAWIIGGVEFCRVRVRVHPGVYVPRWQSEALAGRAAALLPPDGVAVDLCTGAGAIACVLQAAAPAARVVATDVDPVAVGCARRNGVDALLGDLDGPLPAALLGTVDVMVAVVPYVPTDALAFLPRDVTAFEPRWALDGGPGGLELLAAVVARSTRWLRPGGRLLLEVGGDQAPVVAGQMAGVGFVDIAVHRDEEGQDRTIEGRRPGRLP
jgi:release factor glutamine methyltransferase